MRLPASTFFTPRKDLFSNGEPVQLISQPNAHTDGDILVFFRKSDVVATGDVFVTTSYPVIDTARGGSVQGVIDALNAIIELTVPERNQMGGTRVIPGHGRICNEADVVDYRDMVTIIRDRVQEMARKGMTVQQIKAARPSLEYDGIYGATTGTGLPICFLKLCIAKSPGGSKSMTVQFHATRGASGSTLASVVMMAVSLTDECNRQGTASRSSRGTPRAVAPADFTGYWAAVITEDWRFRMVTAAEG